MQYSVIYEPIEFQIPASACSSILHISHNFQKQKKRTKHYCTRQIESDSNSDWQVAFIFKKIKKTFGKLKKNT